ncbi:NAD(P)-dependent oxidoreductase [Actinacidiphila acididurans]|uniref:NAD(P)H-binding protein n=1 Tax=Actinacidiphila acididurans TaxID=2784346 RepID=A0ABS2TMX2_9ACTN|nr:NAD(P)H-binding protein [Actinacidiphila acididurans]MBM9504346.1 NAD(P)H-binding protein [Actinacidiphila acididurans]
MRIAVYGATGMIGSRVVAEALSRGHEVIGITRTGGDLPDAVRAVRGDAGNAEVAAGIAGEADVVVSAIGPSRTGGDVREYLTTLRTLVDTLSGSRLLVIGGAGSLLVDGKRIVDQPDFPEIYLPEAQVVAEGLEYLRGLGEGVDWTFFSPAPLIEPGERTGSFKIGTDSPVGDSISAEDFAVALLDEIEKPAFRRARFTAAN